LKITMRKNTFILGILLLGLSVFALGGCGGGGSDPGALAQWNGEWKGMQTFLDSPTMDSAYEAVASQVSGYTADGVKMFMKSMYNSDVASMKIQGNSILFTVEDSNSTEKERKTSTVTRTYASKGTVPMTGYEGSYWHQFEATNEGSGGYTYVVTTTAHADSPDSMKHWHFRCGNESFEALTDSSLAMWWPTMVAGETTTEAAAQDTMEAAEEYASFLSQLPPLSGWTGEWVSMAGYLDNELMTPAYEATVEEAAKLGKTYTVQQVKAFIQAMYATSCSGFTITGEAISFLDDQGNVIAKSDYACAGLLPMTGYAGYYWNVFEATGTASGYSDVVATEVHGGHEGGLTHWHIRYGDRGAKALADYENPNWWPTLVRKGTSAEKVATDALEDAAAFAAMLP